MQNGAVSQIDPASRASRLVPTIVAIGASAGGLEALRELFGAATVDERLAFVVVTHLPQHHVSYLPELLRRAGALPVREAQDGELLAGGVVYVMPPGRLMGLHDGAFSFEPSARVRAPVPKPIDFFMSSMADVAGDRCVGIVLSGTDHDGTVGLKAIKAAGGLTLVQDPDTAEFPSMPRSAIAAGVADRVLAPRAMPAALLDCLGHQPADAELGAGSDGEPEAAGTDRLNDVLVAVLARTGNDFRWYRPAMLRRRLRRRMVLVGREHLSDYLALLDRSPDEASALGGEFLVGVTDFFRDPEAWDEFADTVLSPLLAERHADDRPFRVWTPGCSSGEESYSIAMVLQEQLGARGVDGSIQVFGTDIDLEALAVARQGAYPEGIAATVSPPRLARFFERRSGQLVVRKVLRDAVTFAPQNLVRDTPFSRLDLILCRNVLMYFHPALQERVLQLFHFALKPRGLLWLGKAESLAAQGTLFEPVSRGIRLFRRVGGRSHLPRGFTELGGSAPPGRDRRRSDRPTPPAEILRNQLSERHVAAAVLVDRDGRALYFQGQTGLFLAPSGDATLELTRLVRQELRVATRTVLRQVLGEAREAARNVMLDGAKITLAAEAVASGDSRGLVVVTFARAQGEPDGAQSAATLANEHEARDQELEDSRHSLALALDDAERSNEDLRLAHEEAISLNEELQSSNEELESSKEELQSLNEEMATVNAQLEDKIAEVTRGAEDLTNLLDSTHIATVLLDAELRIRRFTPTAAALFSLRAGDEGRLLSDLSSRLDDPAFAADAQAVLATGKPTEAEVRHAGGAVLLRRILPYQTGDERITGVVATFIDLTAVRDAARVTRQLAAIVDDSNDAIFSYDLQGRILTWNKGAERTYGRSREAALATDVFAMAPAAAGDAARDVIQRACSSGSIGPEEADRVTQDGRIVRVSMTVSALRDNEGRPYALLSTERDVTERLRVESEVRFRRLADDIPALLRVEDPHGVAQFVNRACVEFTGQPRAALMGHGWLQFVHPADRDAYLAEHSAASAARARLESDFRLQRHDGAYRWVRSISVPHAAPDGQFAGYVSLMLDVEDRKRAESALQTADRRKDEFLAMLAHELRNPLAPIGNAARLIAQSGPKDDHTRWAVGIIERQTDVLAKLLDGLLDVARIARGKTVLSLAPVDISVVVDRAVEVSQPLIDTRRQRLVITPPPAHIIVEGDLLRLTQVLANLLNNASKYTDEGGEIGIAVERAGADAVIRISDNGAGLAPEMLARVFDLFAQADRTLDRSKGGLGLGLTLARQLVELHHGSVQAQSEGLGKGSTFTVRLPLLVSAASRSTGGAATQPGWVPAEARRVLVVDDHADGVATLAKLLELSGHVVSIARDGPAALEMAERFAPDVVILDIGLPGMDGYQVARHLRGRAATSRATIVALTGYGRPEDVAAAKKAGFDRHLVKPVDLDTLSNLVATAARQAT